MSQLHQFQLTYVTEQDRLLLRINTLDKHEFRFWLTRRYTKQFWQALLTMLKNRQPQQYSDVQTQAAVLSFQHQHAVSQADFASQYQAGCALPLGEQPILAARLGLKTDDKTAQQRLCLHPNEGMGLEFNLTDTMLHGLCRMLADVTQQAEWDIQLDAATIVQPMTTSTLN